MNKLIRIIFLLLLVQSIFADACKDTTDCSGDTTAGYICVANTEGNGCEEKESCTAKKSESESEKLTDENCKNLQVYSDQKEILVGYTCVANADGTACEKKLLVAPKCPIEDGPGENECSDYSASENHACIEDTDNKGKCKEEYLCGSFPIPEDNKEVDCSIYPVTNSDSYTCVKNSDEGAKTACKEEEKQNSSNSTTNETQTVSEVTTTSIATTISKEIETTSLLNNGTISTTIITNQTSISSTIQQSNGETSIVFLGCSLFNMASSYFTFIIHFISLTNSLLAKTLTFPLTIIYNTYLRRLDDVNANCDLEESNSESMVNYNCKVEADTANIKQIKLQPTFTFSDGKVSLAGITPLAKMSMNNLQDTNKYSSLLSSNPSIYILDNSIFYGYANYKFNISGTINGEKPSTISVNKDLTLMMNIQNSENEDEVTKEADCTVTDISNDKYTLDCTTTDKSTYDLQSAMSINDNKILLVNIDEANNEDGTVLDPYTEDDVQVKNYSKKSGGIGAGAIVGIVIACVAVLAAVLTTILCLKKSPNNISNNNTDIVNIKNITN